MTTAWSGRLTALAMVAALGMWTGCRWKSPAENVLYVRSGGIAADSSQTFATVIMPGFARVLNPEQVAAGAAFPVEARGGQLQVRFIRVKGEADTIGRAEITLAIVKGYTYSAGLSRQRAGLFTGCIGCNGTLKFPMSGSAAASTDSLHLDYVHGPPPCKHCVAEANRRNRPSVAAVGNDSRYTNTPLHIDKSRTHRTLRTPGS